MAEETLTALLIEDNPGDARLLQELVSESRARLKLLHATRLVDGLEILRRGSIDLWSSNEILSVPWGKSFGSMSRARRAVCRNSTACSWRSSRKRSC